MVEISAVIIARDECDRIGRCIDSLVGVVQEIIVIDSGSQDDTVAIARQHGATVYSESWQGYGANKNIGAQYASHEWILSIDSDEWLDHALRREIKNLVPQRGTLYRINRKNHYLGQVIHHGGWSPDWVDRLYHRSDASWDAKPVHEKLDHKSVLRREDFKAVLHHDSYRSEMEHINKTIQYATLKATSWIATGKSPSIAKRFFGAGWKALHSYVVRMGVLDGKAGWQIAKMNAFLVREQIRQYDRLMRECR